MTNTYYEIIKALEAFKDYVPDSTLKEFNTDTFDRFTADNHKYPLMWAAPTNMIISNGQIVFRIQITFMDTVREKMDMSKVLSDLAITVTEFVSYFDDNNEKCYYMVNLPQNFEPFFRKQNNSTGWQGNVDFIVRFQADENMIRV